MRRATSLLISCLIMAACNRSEKTSSMESILASVTDVMSLTNAQLAQILADPKLTDYYKTTTNILYSMSPEALNADAFAVADNNSFTFAGVTISGVKNALARDKIKWASSPVNMTGNLGILMNMTRAGTEMIPRSLSDFQQALDAVAEWSKNGTSLPISGSIQSTSAAGDGKSLTAVSDSIETSKAGLSLTNNINCEDDEDTACTNAYLTPAGQQPNGCGDSAKFMLCFESQHLADTLSYVSAVGKVGTVLSSTAETVLKVANKTNNVASSAGGCSDNSLQDRLTCLYGSADNTSKVFDCKMNYTATCDSGQILDSMELR